MYYSAIKKNEILPFTTISMGIEGIMLSEISQTQKDKYRMISLSMESKKQNKWKNIKQKQTYRYREKNWWLPEGSGAEEWVQQVREIKRYKLSVTK